MAPALPPFCAGAPPAGAQRHWRAGSFGSLYTLLRRVAAPALPPFCAGAPPAGAQRHWRAESFGSVCTPLRRLESFETVQRGQELEGLAGGAGVVARLPARRFLRRHRASQHDLTIARAHQLVTEPRHLVGGHVGEDGRGRFVVLVLEPGEALGATEDGRELGTLALPRGGPALLARVLRARLEEKTHGAARHGDLEVAVPLVAALVEGESDPGVVGRVHRAPGMLRHVGEGLVAGDAPDIGQEIAAHGLELGSDARLDRFHAGLEAVDLEDFEVGGGEAGERHAGPPQGYVVSGSRGKIGRRMRLKSKRARLEEDRPGASTSTISRAMGSKAAR